MKLIICAALVAMLSGCVGYYGHDGYRGYDHGGYYDQYGHYHSDRYRDGYRGDYYAR